MIQVITRRWPPARIVVVPVRVQGDGAAEEIAKALKLVHRIPDVDVVITGRGGGSLEDLWCFNTEVVARAVAACRIPVIAAVGHEIDVSIADLVADRRALTPSEAGELVVPSARDLHDSLIHTAHRMRQTLRDRLDRARLRLSTIEARSVLQRPMSLVDQKRLDCEALSERAVTAVRLMTERRGRDLAEFAASLQALSPLRVLSRGYSLTQRSDGALLRSAAGMELGEILTTRLASGLVRSAVTAIEIERSH
jgi:exodeoxyribonuclease VII large subunit